MGVVGLVLVAYFGAVKSFLYDVEMENRKLSWIVLDGGWFPFMLLYRVLPSISLFGDAGKILRSS